jgi:hypothetical protein
MFGEIISKYTRKDALEDGCLIDVTAQAKENGFAIPVAITSALHHEINNIPSQYAYQSYEGRLRDLLLMGYMNARANLKNSRMMYKYIMPTTQQGKNSTFIRKYISVCLEVHGGDEGEPVVTIMLPHED